MKLSEFEMEVMQVIWKLGETTAPEVHKEIIKDKEVTYATVKTIINRLEEKSAIARTRNQGRTIFIKALVSSDEFKTPLLGSLIRRVFGGEKRVLFNHIVNDDTMSKEDVEYLERLLAEKKKQL